MYIKFLLFGGCFGPNTPDHFAILYVLLMLIFIIFVVLPRIKIPLTDIAKRNTKNPFYKTRNILGFYEDVEASGELCTLETKQPSILFKIIAIILSLSVFFVHLGTFLNFDSWF